jgi:hypothetical protein
MADQLYLSLWFPNFRLQSLPPALVQVLKQLPAAGGASRVSAAAAYPLGWQESPVFQRIYFEDDHDASPEEAVAEATVHLHDDFAYEFEARWELWAPDSGGDPEARLDAIWRKEPRIIRVVGFGPEFDEGSYEQDGHIRIDFGLDTFFLHEDLDLDSIGAERVRQNVKSLVDLTNAVQENCGISSRLLWSESGEDLAQKLIARLQRVN